ncbi:MAG TPA: energy transducer TonB [Flavobacteriaceae bacterium]|nr:energy transducer TonB [Flavobacteriaceae bacterium]
MSKLNLFGKEWSNVVFEGRNKLYGAYKLRQESAKSTLLALLIGLGIMSIVFGGSHLYAARNSERAIIIEYPNDDPVVLVAPVDTEREEEVPELPKPVEHEAEELSDDTEPAGALADVRENIKLTETVVGKDEEATETLAAQDEFSDEIQSGTYTTEANPDGVIRTEGGQAGTAVEGTDIVTREPAEAAVAGNAIVTLVQVKAEPNEGFQAFYDRFSRKFSPGTIDSNVNEVVVRLRFVVEKDGSFSDIKVLDDKQGLGNEAIRVLKSMPHWKPAQHNGTTVRSMFTLPIKIKINN